MQMTAETLKLKGNAGRLACLVMCMSVCLSMSGAKTPRIVDESDVESYKYEVGAGIGMSGYLGDANESNMFKHPGVNFNGTFRYLASPRFAVRGMLNISTLTGNTADWDNVLPENKQYEFHATAYELCGRAEFNFFPYGIGETYKRLKRWTPYLTLGLGVCLSTCDGNTSVAPTLPMGVGVKYKINRRLNLAGEFVMTKVFGDKVDGPDLSDLYTIKSSFLKNTDWYSGICFTLTYEFGPRCATCNRID